MTTATLPQTKAVRAWAGDLAEVNALILTQGWPSADVKETVSSLTRQILGVKQSDLAKMDPYLWMALQTGALTAAEGLLRDDSAQGRHEVRVGLEQSRQALRDLFEEGPVSEDRPAKEVVQWLAQVLYVPQPTLAELLGTEVRTLQRWLSLSESAAPQGDRATRVRVVARITNHLRHALTGPGVVLWFSRPRRELDNRAPVDLLDEYDAIPELITLAAQARSTSAT